MATLTGQTIALSYEQLLSLPNGGLSGTSLVAITDGDSDTACALQVATGKVLVKPTSSTDATFEVEEADGTAILSIDATAGTTKGVIINEDSQTDVDFRVEGGTEAYLLFCDASSDRVGIGTAAPSTEMHVKTTSGSCTLKIEASAGGVGVDPTLQLSNNGTSWNILNDDTNDNLTFYGGSATRMSLTTSGNVGIGTTAPSQLLDVASTTGGIMTVSRNDATISDTEALGKIYFSGLDSSVDVGAYINAFAAEAWTGGSAAGTDLAFGTCLNTASTVTERMRILDNGKIGIGTTAPVAALAIKTSAAFALTYNSTAHNIHLLRDATEADDAYGGSISFAQLENDVQTMASIALVQTTADCNTCGIAFFTHPSLSGVDPIVEQMRIEHDGKVGIGTTAPTSPLHVYKEMDDNGVLSHFEYHTSDNAVDANDTIMILEFGDDNTEAGTPYFMQFNDSDSIMAHIQWDTDNSTVFTDASDYRIKSNIEPMDGSLSDINKLKPSSFNIKEASKKAYGFIAHELDEVYPSMVTGEKDAVDDDGKIVLQSVSYSKLIPFMVKAIQELSAKVTVLEAKDTEYATTITSLTARITALENA